MLVGQWVMVAGQPTKDDVCLRIEWLTSQCLKQISVSKHYGAWETLYQDPHDGRFWERTYPQGEMYGGGPPTLTAIPSADAKAKYEIDSP
jgi:Immunity protein 27